MASCFANLSADAATMRANPVAFSLGAMKVQIAILKAWLTHNLFASLAAEKVTAKNLSRLLRPSTSMAVIRRSRILAARARCTGTSGLAKGMGVSWKGILGIDGTGLRLDCIDWL